jgi:hypothetical protein
LARGTRPLGGLQFGVSADPHLRIPFACGAKSKEAFDRDDAEVRRLLVKWRAEGVGPSDMARWTGFTREWVAKIAPAPSKEAIQAAIRRRIDENAARNAADSS